jgi:heat-inducible transcriptional repressor
MLTDRKSRILRIIAEDYISTATPVASSAVARAEGLGVSPATVRNEMVALEEEGFILRPHISAGGIPSDKGYRQFVQWLSLGAEPGASDARAVEAGLSDAAEDVDEWADAAAGALAALLDTVAFATPLRSRASSVKSVELLGLQDMLVMMVVIMREAAVYRQLINATRPITSSDLEKSRNRVNSLVSGKSFAELQSLDTRPEDELDRQMVMSTMDVIRRHEAGALKERSLQGLSRLFQQPEFEEDAERARHAVTAIESDDIFADLVTSASSDGIPVTFIGSENRHVPLHEFSVILCDYGVPGEAHGVVGILAPTRVEYQRAIPLIAHTGLSLSGIARRVYGYAS